MGETQTSKLSEVLSNCGGRGVWNVRIDDTLLLLLCNCGVQNSVIRLTTAQTAFTAALTTADPNPFNSGPTVVASASVRADTAVGSHISVRWGL